MRCSPPSGVTRIDARIMTSRDAGFFLKGEINPGVLVSISTTPSWHFTPTRLRTVSGVSQSFNAPGSSGVSVFAADADGSGVALDPAGVATVALRFAEE